MVIFVIVTIMVYEKETGNTWFGRLVRTNAARRSPVGWHGENLRRHGPLHALDRSRLPPVVRVLEQPGVIWLSESRNQVVARDDRLAQAIGLAIDPGRNLPDLILVDLGPAEPLLIFVEVVATDGPVNEARQAALMAIATEAGFGEQQVAFVTAYTDRDAGTFKGSVSELAWRSFAWFMSEPEHIMVLHRGADADRALLSELMRG